MAAWNGKPVLALTSLGQVPLVPPSSGKAGARAGFLAAFDNSGHTAADEVNFAYAKRAASQHGDYDYSHQFLVGLAAGNALLAALSGERADIARARAEEDRIAHELAADRAAGITGDATLEFEFYPMDEDQPALPARGHVQVDDHGIPALAAIEPDQGAANHVALRRTHVAEQHGENKICTACSKCEGTPILWPCLILAAVDVAEDFTTPPTPSTAGVTDEP